MSSDKTIRTHADAMLEDTRAALNLVICLPDGHETFQRKLIEAALSDRKDLSALAQTISLASAALAVADSGEAGTFEPWYRQQVQGLLRRSIDIVAVVEANSEPRLSSRLN
ncbi:MAG: hypothetical protein GC182_14830 [Rhodopseudomonas sp.]|nr:hypothetical protein [Rhodopseudomonas sp.]